MTSTTHEKLPVIPLRDMVVFPGARVPFVVGRAASVEAVRAAIAGDRRVFLVMQKDAEVREPGARDLHAIGTVGRVLHDVRLPDGNFKILVEGVQRARILGLVQADQHLAARVSLLATTPPAGPDAEAGRRRLIAAFEDYGRSQPGASLDQAAAMLAGDDPAAGCDDLAARLPLTAVERQELLECLDGLERLTKLEMLLHVELDKARLERRLSKQVQQQVEQAQREYLLNEKMKAIQKELGKKGGEGDLQVLETKVKEAGMPAEALEKATQELRRLEAMAPMSAEATVSRTYLEWMTAIPWKKRTRERRDFDAAARVLEEDHHGLAKVKERILEFLAVRTLQKGKPARGSILCFVGPPGVGKTSLGRSIARATGRKFVRVSLGGVRDEAEIRGHRRTYIGAYPGRVIQMMRKAGTRNPVLLLDEVDKMSTDFRGDPSAALLEVLDPEQNKSFVDHYLDTDYDLSEVLFVCTANVLHGIPAALRDRLEVIHIPGYTVQEKVAIAERFLLPKQLEAHGLEPAHLVVTRDGMLAIIEHYTREAGVRNLEREIAGICRKAATKVVRNADVRLRVESLDDARAHLGVPRFRPTTMEREPEVGLAMGLAWTEHGGQILTVEATRMTGRGKLMITGQLGDVMQESLRAAVSYVRARSRRFGLSDDLFRSEDIHVHVPEGAVPKDGPSAGITLAIAVVSVLTGRPVRHDVALTGEITLRGRVLPVGGIKEKILAAHRAGLRCVVLPKASSHELEDVPQEVRDALEIVLVEDMDEVLDLVLLPAPIPPPGQAGGPLPDREARA